MASDLRRFSFSLALFLLSALVVTSTCVRTVDGRKKIGSDHMISVESLSPGEECTVTSQDAGRRPPGLKVVSRHGPCSPNRQNISLTQILNQDRIRVNWIRSKITGKSQQAPPPILLAGAEIPANTGDSFSFDGAYVVTVGFGTPSLQQTVMFDTGSDVTWIQCQPCPKHCYQQKEQMFDPKKSSTYATISCSSPYCSSTELSLYNCTTSGATCIYGVQYGDGFFTVGYYSTDTLAITSTDTIQNFRFGCGKNQGGKGPSGQIAGLMGLGRAPSSIVLQTESTYGGLFSYCLPPTSSSTGYLAFGSGSVPSSNVQYTPMLSRPGGASSFYFLLLISISVGGTKLAIPPTVFLNAGTLIDSGTTITHLPPTAYSELRTAFTAQMTKYKMSKGVDGLDACYDFTGLSTVSLPSVVLEFEGVSVDLDPNGILFEDCLAFSPNGADVDVGIIGNVIQKTISVVYDVPNLRIGFGIKGC